MGRDRSPRKERRLQDGHTFGEILHLALDVHDADYDPCWASAQGYFAPICVWGPLRPGALCAHVTWWRSVYRGARAPSPTLYQSESDVSPFGAS